jgi:hypothetical protein
MTVDIAVYPHTPADPARIDALTDGLDEPRAR